jgi:glycopeptide antibiotics resistance protein
LTRSIDQYRLEPPYLWIAAGIAVTILYGSFFPFGFYLHQDPRGPIGALLDTGFRPSSRDDVVANILLYIPFGFFAAYALPKRSLAAIAYATLAGFALSLFVELLQFYDAGRVQSISDVYCNTLGALLGAAAAPVARKRVSSIFLSLMLVCWLGSRWYPASPSPPAIPLLNQFRFLAAWLAVGLMLETLCGVSRSRVILPLLLTITLLIRAFASYVDPAEIIGGAAAALLWSAVLWRLRARATITAALFVALVILLALAPFHFLTAPRAFSWMPFRSFLETATETAIRVFFEKAFYYGGTIWLLVRAGLSIGVAAALGGTLVFGLRLLQVYLPDRSAEITDATLLLMLAALLKLSSQPHIPPNPKF